MKQQLVKLLRRNSHLAGWFDRRNADHQLTELRALYAPKVAAAEKNKNWDERDELLLEWDDQGQQITDPLKSIESDRLVSKARQYGIIVPPKTDKADDWFRSPATGDWILTYEVSQRIAKAVRDERRGSHDEFRKWATAGFAVLGFTLGLVSLVRTNKPDPCPVNYYRNQNGSCVFGLKEGPASPKSFDSAGPSKVPTKEKATQGEQSFVPY